MALEGADLQRAPLSWAHTNRHLGAVPLAMLIAGNVVAIVALLLAAYLLVQQRNDWGWFLFVAAIIGLSVNDPDVLKSIVKATPGAPASLTATAP